MAQGDVRHFGGKRYRYMGWSRGKADAERSAEIGRQKSKRSWRVVREEDSSGTVSGFATYREIVSRR